MFSQLTSLLARWRDALQARRTLDDLLSHVPSTTASLRSRTNWILDLLQWIRSEGTLAHNLDFDSGAPQAARVRYFLQVLDRHPDWKSNTASLLRSFFRDTEATNLFLTAGITSQDSFWGEVMERLHYRFLPQPPNDHDLASMFAKNFANQRDVQWMNQLDTETFERILGLLQHEFATTEHPWNNLNRDAKDALLLLAIQVEGIGLGAHIRYRLKRGHFTELPFYRLRGLTEKMVNETDRDQLLFTAFQIEKTIEESFLALNEVYHHLDEYGVSTHIVYQIDRMQSQLLRMQQISSLIIRSSKDPEAISSFLGNLIEDNSQRFSIWGLVSENFSLLSKKIAERSAETGEHYIARTRKEFRAIFVKALGGGYITAFTTIVKYGAYYLGLNVFFTGIYGVLNYSISFLIIHFAGFTLGTKQPAMTAPALAAKMHKIRDPEALENLVDDIIHIIRTQVAAVLGNVIGVVPITLALCGLIMWAASAPLLSQEKAVHTMHDFSILGPTPLYAAFTGVLLWLSSVFAGWADNWFVFRRLGPALSHDRRLVFVFGELGARKIGVFFKSNMLALAGNISLGFFLGLTPAVMQFFGFPLDVRHVTLSSGSLTAAVISLPYEVVQTWDFWLAVMGVISMGFLNIGVAFGLAMFVAIRARRVQAPERNLIYKALWKRLKAQPTSLFLPPPSIN
ncbi:MAG: site-specific recombinase [Bdellovibrionota bacterium]